MRTKTNDQPGFGLSPSNLKLANGYYRRYEAVSSVLDENPKILTLVHKDLEDALQSEATENSDGSRLVLSGAWTSSV